MGLVSGQVIGGVVGDYFGWRNVFVFIAALFVIVALTLASRIAAQPADARLAAADRSRAACLPTTPP